MTKTGFVATVEFGTSKITGIVATKNEQGISTIIASETLASDGCVKAGIIYNIELAAGKMNKLVSLLENKIGEKIGYCYVSLAGKGMKAVEHIETKLMEGDETVTLALKNALNKKALDQKEDFLHTIDIYQPQYYLDGKLEENPIGKVAARLDFKCMLVMGPPNIKTVVKKCVEDKSKLKLKNTIIGHIASSVLLLNEKQTKEGCVLIDFGAGTTTASIYKGGLLKYMIVLPFGGNNITKDIMSLGFDMKKAEDIKIKYGFVGKKKRQEEKEKPQDVNLNSLIKVIQYRMDEIVLNLLDRLKKSGYYGNLDAGIILTGGASKLSGMTDYLEEKMKLPATFAVPQRLLINNASDLTSNPAYSSILGTLLFASEDCSYIEQKMPPQPEPSVQPVPSSEPIQSVETVEPKEQKTVTPAPNEANEKEINNRKQERVVNDSKKNKKGILDRLKQFGETLFPEER